MDSVVKEAIEIELLPNNMNREVGFVSASHGSLLFASLRNLRNMTPDLQGYAGQCTLDSLAPRPLVQCSLVSSGFPLPETILYRLWPATCSPFSTEPSPLLSINFPCGPLSLPSCPYIAGCFRLVAESAATCSRWFLARGFFYPEDGGDTFLRNVNSHKLYTAPHPRRRNSSTSAIARISSRSNVNNVITNISALPVEELAVELTIPATE
jgi:hypothetical protein